MVVLNMSQKQDVADEAKNSSVLQDEVEYREKLLEIEYKLAELAEKLDNKSTDN